ncbi:LysR substrate-binding domain-containing protein [Shimia sp.]|uniref:LysR substrate-binding domain-containing protein n=1 Tax=Shimia sp. TaxID=1954381 RepID=UPI0035686339
MTKLPHVTWLRSFEAAARLGSFTAAAEALNLTPAAVSQQIKLLEQHLGASLFVRLPRGVALTDLGQAYAQPVRKGFAEMREATDGLFGARQKRRLRVHASISYGTLVLAPLLAGFHAAHPEIEVQLTSAVWTDRTEDAAFDVEIRYGHGDWDERDIRHLGHRSSEVLCHPAVAAACDAGPTLEALAEKAVQIIGSETDWGRLAALYGRDLPPVPGMMRADSSLMALQILSGGTGAAIISESFSKTYLDRGLLVSPLDCKLPMSRSFFLVLPDARPMRREVIQFCDWLYDLHRNQAL